MKKALLFTLALLVLTGCAHQQQSALPDNASLEDMRTAWNELDSISYDIVVVKSNVEGQEIPPMKYYSKDRNKNRIDTTDGTQETVFINNEEDQTSYVLYPESETYLDLSILGNQAQKTQAELVDDLFSELEENFENTGVETVNGQDAFALVGTSQGVQQKVWISKVYAVPVKIQTFNEKGELISDIEMQNISAEPLDDSLFQIPEGYEPINLLDLFGGADIPTELPEEIPEL